MKNYAILFLLTVAFSCKKDIEPKTLEIGTYRATLELHDNEVLPFNFEVTKSGSIEIFNAEEVIELNEIEYKNDSVFIKFPVYEGYLAAELKDGNLSGSYIKESLDRIVPFKAAKGENRFLIDDESNPKSVDGIWETVFSPDNEEDSYIAKGIFKQNGNSVTGTFRTTTGDYRYLDGSIEGTQLKLSTFDGAHAFLFTATVSDSTMQGQFYSGNHWKEPFIAKRNADYELPDADSLTFLKEGYDKITFEFPDENGNMVSLDDDRFKDKVVLVQIMGTWCPNCLDESRFYSEYYNNNKNKDIEIIALAFEYTKTQERALTNIRRLKENTGISYPVLLAQVGTSSKVKANEKLPMLNHVLSYPTTIYIDKKGRVRKIHTGFNGPATGDKYDEFVNEFKAFTEQLLSE